MKDRKLIDDVDGGRRLVLPIIVLYSFERTEPTSEMVIWNQPLHIYL